MALRKPKVIEIDFFDTTIGAKVAEQNYSFLPKTIIWINDTFFVGLQKDSWESDLNTWDFLNSGRQTGKSSRNEAKEISIVGATYEKVGFDTIARVNPSLVHKGSFLINSVNPFAEEPHQTTEYPVKFNYEVIDCITGNKVVNNKFVIQNNLVNNNDPITNTAPFALENGSYILRVRVESNGKYELPPKYKINNLYEYTDEDTGEKYIYDPYYNVGRIPSDINHYLLNIRRNVLKSGEQKDKPEWSKYLISARGNSGEWSQLKIICGTGEWSFNSDLCISIGPVLMKKEPVANISINDENVVDNSRTFINFDPLCRSIDNFYLLKNDIKKSDKTTTFLTKDTVILSGNRSTRTGTSLAVWTMKPNGIIELIATAPNLSNGLVDSDMINHGITDVILKDGNLLFLTRSKLYQLSNDTGVLFEVSGIGGESLTSLGSDIFYVTPFGTESNAGKIINGKSKEYGDETSYYGKGVLTTWLNQIWSVFDEDGTQFIAPISSKSKVIRNENNQPDTPFKFPNSDYKWQHLIEMNNSLVAFGKRSEGSDPNVPIIESEEGVVAVSDGNNIRFSEFDYRLVAYHCYLSNDVDFTGEKIKKIAAIGHKIYKNKRGKSIINQKVYYLLDIDVRGENYDFTYDDVKKCFVSEELPVILLPSVDAVSCGKMDVMIVIDDTGSMDGAINSVKSELLNIFDEIESSSLVNGKPDYRIGLMGIKEDPVVYLQMSHNNKYQVSEALNQLVADGGYENYHIAINQCVNMIFPVAPLDSEGWREDALKIIINVTDTYPGDESPTGDSVDLLYASAETALEKGILIASVAIGRHIDCLEDIGEITGGSYLEIENSGVGTGEAIREIIYNCGGKSKPLNILAQEEFASNLWRQDGDWVPNTETPVNTGVEYLSLGFEPQLTSEGEVAGTKLKYCQSNEENRDDYFTWSDTEPSGFKISVVKLAEKYGKNPSEIKDNYKLVGNCFIPMETAPIDNNDITTLKVVSNGIVNLQVNIDDLPFNPNSDFGEGNSLQFNGDSLCVFRTLPSYSYDDCNVIRTLFSEYIRGRIVNGIFIPCDPVNGLQAYDTMPEGTGWQIIKIPRHGEYPINILELKDVGEKYLLEKTDKYYFTAWYRTDLSVPFAPYSYTIDTFPYDENNIVLSREQQFQKKKILYEKNFFANFTKRMKYGSLTKLKNSSEDTIEVLLLVAPQASPTPLPAIMRVI